MDEFETYEDVIDSYNSGVGVEAGESLTDYIKRNNIKIKEIEMDPIGDFEKILKGSKPMEKEGITQLASGDMYDDYDPNLVDEYQKYRFDMLEQGLEPIDIDQFRREAMSDMAAIRPEVRIEEVVKEFIRQNGRKPNSLEELKEFYEMRVGTASRDVGMDTVKELVEDEKTRITLAGGSFPDLSGDGEITKKDILIGRGVIDRDEKQSGGIAAILGV